VHKAALGEDTWLGQRWGRTRVVTAKPAFSPGWCYQPGLKKHTRIVCFFQALVRRWIRGVFLLRDCELLDQHYQNHFVSHMTLYIGPLPDMSSTQ
jgi:hypothetical protein